MRIYFCSDIHASDRCWKKFLASAKFYDADVIVMGGDITGKFVVPIIEQKRDRYLCRFNGVERKLSGKDLEKMSAMIADGGSYAYVTTDDEYRAIDGDPVRVDELFRRLALERLGRWMEMADERLGDSTVRVLVSAGNDDYPEVDEVLARSAKVEDPNEAVVELGGDLQLIGLGYGNRTPWACPRDISEEELAQRIDTLVSKVREPERTIFSFHVPPYDTGLDSAPRLDGEMRPVMGPAGVEMVPVGSTAVREALLRYRPFLGLHGHIHESRAIIDLEGVLAANPGSEYGEGILNGILIDVEEGRAPALAMVTG
ncbi:MAG: metallophosphoesterase [Acidimicrobiaceae bacterium]|nr:metallophosphoesterase [Acidimicrobiaceae bacterium]